MVGDSSRLAHDALLSTENGGAGQACWRAEETGTESILVAESVDICCLRVIVADTACPVEEGALVVGTVREAAVVEIVTDAGGLEQMVVNVGAVKTGTVFTDITSAAVDDWLTLRAMEEVADFFTATGIISEMFLELQTDLKCTPPSGASSTMREGKIGRLSTWLCRARGSEA